MSATALPDQLSAPAHEFAARRHRLLIHGQPTPPADGIEFEILDPATGQAITTVAAAGPADIDRAVAAARRALQDPAWAGLSAARRARLLHRLADVIEEHADELAEL